MGCVAGGVGFGNLGDHVRRIKVVLILLFVASTLLVAWFTLVANRVLPASTWQLFTSCTLGRCVLLCNSVYVCEGGERSAVVCLWNVPVALVTACTPARLYSCVFVPPFPTSLTMNAGSGLFYEAAADLVYPLDSMVSTTMLTLVFNGSGAVYTMLGARISPSAMNWLLTGRRTLYSRSR